MDKKDIAYLVGALVIILVIDCCHQATGHRTAR